MLIPENVWQILCVKLFVALEHANPISASGVTKDVTGMCL